MFSSPSAKDPHQRFTNCVITCVWADGKNRTPPMLLTWNAKMRDQGDTTKLRKEARARFNELKDQFGVEDDQICWVNNSKKQFMKESSALLELYFEVYGHQVPKGAVIFHDEGSAFKIDKEHFLGRFGFEQEVVYPPAVHHYISPNDNCMHGVAKSVWRSKCPDLSDDVVSSIFFVHCLNNVKPKDVRGWFDRNFILSKRDVTEADVESVIDDSDGPKKRDFGRDSFHLQCLQEYREWHSGRSRRSSTGFKGTPGEIATELDGLYWKLWQK